jgi:hypothetical protein
MTQADGAFVRAITTANTSDLENLLDADFTWTTGAGVVQTRAQVLQQPRMAITTTGKMDSKVYSYGDLGVVEVNQARMHALRVWVKRPAGWRVIVFQEVLSLEAPPSFTPGAGKDCTNPCKTIPFTPQNETERQVALRYSELETAAHAHNSTAFGQLVGDEFAAASSNNKLQTKRSRMEEFDRAKDGGLAPTPLLSARMFVFGDAVLMISEHQPDHGSPLHVTRG